MDKKWRYSIVLSNNNCRVNCNIKPTFATSDEMREINHYATNTFGYDTEEACIASYKIKLAQTITSLTIARDKKVTSIDRKITELNNTLNGYSTR